MSSLGSKNAPAPQGKMFGPHSIRVLDQCVQKPHLKTRMKADDSASVLMSDNKLGKPISNK